MEKFQNCNTNENNSPQNSIHVTDTVIQNVTSNRGTAFVTIGYDDCSSCRNQAQVTLIVSKTTEICNEQGEDIPVTALQAGMVVDATFSKNMTRSIPPQTQAFRIYVKDTPQDYVSTSGCILEVNRRGQYIRTISNGKPSSIIRFNISPETRILDQAGKRITLSTLTPGLHVRVDHANFMTASIPPQTSAFTIQIMK